jgi:hypothetical protein
MEVHFTPEQEARLAQIATNAGTDAEGLVNYRLPVNNRGRRLQLGQRPAGLPEADCDRRRP